MKSILLTCFITLIIFKTKANDTIVYQREGLFEYALIEGGLFHHSLRPLMKPYSHVVRKISMKSKSIPYRHVAGSPNDPNLAFNWHLSNNTVFSYDVIPRYDRGIREGLTIHIVYREFETRDSLVVSQNEPQWVKENMISFSPIGAYFRTWHPAKISPVAFSKMIDKFYSYLNFDISYSSSDSLINFYMRDKDVFYIWSVPLTSVGMLEPDWRLKKAYAAPNYDPEFIPRIHNRFYDSTKTHHNAITDTLFFDGHFKVLKQNGEKYIINRQHGIIYHMGANAITPIGRVMVTGDYPKIQGKSLFIEDRDNNRIIFFAPVKWIKNNLPKPKVYYMKSKEIKEYFKHVMS
jgi:hypothetical protein